MRGLGLSVTLKVSRTPQNVFPRSMKNPFPHTNFFFHFLIFALPIMAVAFLGYIQIVHLSFFDDVTFSPSRQRSQFASILSPLPPAGSWAAFPNSTLRPAMGNAPWNPAFIFSYSGGWFDENRNELGVWGGGHADYPGNEVCTFPLSTGVWACGPRSAYVQDPTTETTADGNPSSRHTYSCIARVKAPGYDGFFCHGGSLWRGRWGTGGAGVYPRGSANGGRVPDRAP